MTSVSPSSLRHLSVCLSAIDLSQVFTAVGWEVWVSLRWGAEVDDRDCTARRSLHVVINTSVGSHWALRHSVHRLS